jgi:tubulin epsilon
LWIWRLELSTICSKLVEILINLELGEIFDTRRFVYDVSGAGNNWAHGFGEYGPKYRDDIGDAIRKNAEECNSLQSFFLLHSLGGGTGSGLGSYILTLLDELFPNVFKFTASVFPSEDDDVVTSPYNSLLAATKLVEYADCVLPIDNDSLIRLVTKKETTDKEKSKKEAYADMNSMIAHLLSNLTCSMRFPGSLNIDMNEITMNLVPYPRMHFLLSSMAPLQAFIKLKNSIPRSLDQMFMDTLNKDHHFLDCNAHIHRYISLAYLIRGDVSFSDVSRNIEKIAGKINLISWNAEGFKYGICSVPSLGNVTLPS